MRFTGRVVVTGGAGFIGANLCRLMRDEGIDVVVFDDLSTGSLDNLANLDVEFVMGTILDAESLARATKGASCIVHLAARPSVPRSLQDPIATHEANVTGTLRVLEAARVGGIHTIVASSSSIYGANPELPKRETLTPVPVSPYAVSKLAAEGYALAYQRCFSLPVLVFRFFNVFGLLQTAGHAYAAVVPRFIDAALSNDSLEVHGDGLQTRDFTYVGTVARVLLDAVERRVTHDGAVNLAFGSRVSILDVVAHLEGILGRRLETYHIGERAGDVRASQADHALLQSLFPAATATDLRIGLAETRGLVLSGSIRTSTSE